LAIDAAASGGAGSSRRSESPPPAALSGYLAALGPLRDLVEDDSLTEIMVVGPDRVYVEREGRVHLTDVRFDNEAHLVGVIDLIVTAVGRELNRRHPICEARLLDGSRVAASIPPVALNGPLLTIRKFSRRRYDVGDLVAFGSITEEAAAYLQVAVLARANLIISGGAGSGKTTLLNALSRFIAEEERVVTIEDAAELKLHQEHVCSLESRSGDDDGTGRISIRDLVVHSLRMRPDRIIVGECRAGEALDMLQAMNTGHDGSLTTIHANSPRDCLARLETMVLMAGLDLPVRAIRQHIASAIDVLVHLSRLKDGPRRVVSVSEIVGMEGDIITMQDIFSMGRGTESAKQAAVTRLRPTGVRPQTLRRLEERGIPAPDALRRLFPVPRVVA